MVALNQAKQSRRSCGGAPWTSTLEPCASGRFSVACVHSSVTILNIGQVRAYARAQLARLSSALTPTQRAAIDHQVAAWEPKRGPRYNGTIGLTNLGG